MVLILIYPHAGVLPFDLSSTVTSPGGITEDAEINEIEDGLYAVHFVPKELGVHTVSVRYKDVHIPGMYVCSWTSTSAVNHPSENLVAQVKKIK